MDKEIEFEEDVLWGALVAYAKDKNLSKCRLVIFLLEHYSQPILENEA